MMNAIEDAACQLKDALYVAMADCDAKPWNIFLAPTPAVVIDSCCEEEEGDGQAWVTLLQVRPTSNDNYPCGVESEALFVMGISRCAYTIDDQGNSPSAEELSAGFRKLTRDYKIFRKAVVELFVPEMKLDRNDYRFGDWDSHPVRGGCLLSTQELFVNFTCV